MLAAYIAAGVAFLVVPGTLAGVWNLVSISSHQAPGAAGAAWVQAHGHAQLFGWVGTFILGISLYTLPKFRGGWVRSLGLGWAMLAVWSASVTARWVAAIYGWNYGWNWRGLLIASAGGELLVAVALVWQTTSGRRSGGIWVTPIFAGFVALCGVLAWQLALTLGPLAGPVLPEAPNRELLHAAIWGFCFPVVWGYSGKLVPPLLGLRSARPAFVWVGLCVLAAALVLSVPALLPAAVAAACVSLRILEPSARKPKTNGVDPRYPWFTRSAFAWLLAASILGAFASRPGMLGASRHAFTVGFLATMIFSIGPRILPSFLNSRELASTRLMLWSMILLSAGCFLRVVSEPLAYGGAFPLAWSVLPVSAFIELTAVLLFAANIVLTQLSPAPVWMDVKLVNGGLTIYWLVTSYPSTRPLLQRAGLPSRNTVDRTLTLDDAARQAGIDPAAVIEELQKHFRARLARALRR